MKDSDAPPIRRFRLPDWVKARTGPLHDTKRLLRNHGLRTVCEEARCPNVAGCFSKPSAAFMILGANCTRNCAFCAVNHLAPDQPDPGEPERVALASREMKLKYVVITSVTRDDLEDGGASHFAATVRAVRTTCPEAKVEVLTPDFKGDRKSIDAVIAARPDVFNHNLETVPRLYPKVRPRADFRRSLSLLEYVKKSDLQMLTKSGLMLGLGEKKEEVSAVLKELRSVSCDLLTLGQYLQPSRHNLPVVDYVTPDVFEQFRIEAGAMGFKFVASSPLVRSSMNAEEMYNNRVKRVRAEGRYKSQQQKT